MGSLADRMRYCRMECRSPLVFSQGASKLSLRIPVALFYPIVPFARPSRCKVMSA